MKKVARKQVNAAVAVLRRVANEQAAVDRRVEADREKVHRERVLARLREEAAHEAEHVASYRELVHDGTSSLTDLPIGAVLSFAFGAYDGDLVEGVLEEVEIRTRTLAHAIDTIGRHEVDTLDLEAVKSELTMLGRRAAAARELSRRAGTLVSHARTSAAVWEQRSWEQRSEPNDAAAEE